MAEGRIEDRMSRTESAEGARVRLGERKKNMQHPLLVRTTAAQAALPAVRFLDEIVRLKFGYFWHFWPFKSVNVLFRCFEKQECPSSAVSLFRCRG